MMNQHDLRAALAFHLDVLHKTRDLVLHVSTKVAVPSNRDYFKGAASAYGIEIKSFETLMEDILGE